ncbi:MAG: alkaline phosphatase [Alistipes sp.]|nr:alkaline phosphatase [Alistipes sp.]
MKKSILFLAMAFACVACCDSQSCKTEDAEVKNLIYMIGDGMGLAHVSMLQVEGKYAPTAFDRAENIALMTTYSSNNRVTDSAAAGTALASGYKTNNRMLGMTPDSVAVESMMEKAIRAGKSTGLAYTCYLQHATPGAFYAHSDHRDSVRVITADFLKSNIDVALGGGRAMVDRYFAKEGKNYLDELAALGYQVAHTPEEMAQVTQGKLLGLFADYNMPKMAEGRGDYLLKATNKALEILSNNVAAEQKSGFMLMVEGSKIDYRAHDNDTEGILAEVRDFEKCVAAAMDFADKNPGTLVVVCADHETGGVALASNKADFKLSESGIKYTYGTRGHSGTMVPIYLYGTGAERINGVMDNTDLAKKLMEILKLE